MEQTMVSYVKIFEDEGHMFRWRAHAGNHKIVAVTGEGYQSLKHAENMVARLFPGVPVEVIK